MRAIRNLSFVVLVVASLSWFGATSAKAYGYCDWYGLQPAAYGGLDDPETCTLAYEACSDWDLHGDEWCRSACSGVCETSVHPVYQYCNVTELGNGSCFYDFLCTCDDD